MYKYLSIIAICCFRFGTGYNWRFNNDKQKSLLHHLSGAMPSRFDKILSNQPNMNRSGEGIKLCHRSSPDFQKCLEAGLTSGLYYFRDGDKNLNIPRIDPLEMQPFEVKTDGSQVALRLNFKKPFIGGMSDSTITHVELDVDKDCYWKLDVITPALRLFGEYQIDGKLMMFELNGHGKCNITALDLHHRQTMKCRKFKKDGKEYIKLTDYDIKAKPSKVVYEFEDLVPNSKEITKAILDTFNGEEESLMIYNEMEASLEKYIGEVHKMTIDAAFSMLPLEEFFPM
ncbi:unnamed protein product [Callosobruchus maculatus]|uniref:Uncharacterized protein n=1 Tax=Callosobruchus maculatus TaxID=64391 RepID=A0A653D8Z9_CALMS|nr:unnamed protein product [Callosobruchus maculatus]